MSLPPEKRRRTEDASTKRSSIWYKDGSVVLQAQNTQFRVHWSLLSQNSSFFRDLEDLPQPPEQPTVDGCPVVELPDDEFDVEFVLKALYTPSFLYQTALPLAVIAAHIRLGRKYDFRELLDLAVARLTFEHPTTLQEYDALPKPYIPTRIVPHDSVRFDIVTLRGLEKTAYYLSCPLHTTVSCEQRILLRDGLFQHLERDDGTQASLAPVDLRRCVSGREKILDVQLKPGYPCGWYRSRVPGPNCTGLEHCVELREKCLRTYLDAVTTLKGLMKFRLTSNTELCAACAQDIPKSNAAGRRRMWDELPGFFDLPPWGELKNEL